MEDSSQDVKLILDEPRAVYYSGQLLSGRLECKLLTSVHLAAINVTFLGQATVDWTEEETQEYGTSCKMAVHYMGRETYFNITQGLLGGNGPLQLHPGVHNFPFQFQIPPNVPSSFTSSSGFKGVGKVFYSVKAQVLYGDSSRDGYDVTKEFKVVAPFDLNTGSEDIGKPLALEFEEYYSCFCSSTPICVTVSLPQSGFCPGEDIPITVTSRNDSKVEVKGMLFQLIQKECYHSQEPPSEWVPPEVVIASVKGGPVLSNTKQETIRRLTVPDMIAPNLQNCGIIDVGYFLKVNIQVSGCNKDMDDETEICLGLVPLSTSECGHSYIHPLIDQLPQAPIPEIGAIPQMTPVNDHPGPPVSYVPVSAVPHAGSNMPYAAPVTHQRSPMYNQNSTAPYLNSTAPYPNPAAPYPPTPNSSAPYPSPKSTSPYLNQNSTAPYPNPASPYPNKNSTAPYQHPASPYPNQNSTAPCQNPVSPYPNQNSASPYPNQNPTTPCQNTVSPYPNQNSAAPYPNPASPNPNQNSAAPNLNSASPYPNQNSAAPYPNPASPYPNQNPTTPCQNTVSPYPNQNSAAPYPNPASPNPNQNSAAPNRNSASPYPNQNSAAPYPNPASPYPNQNSTSPCQDPVSPFPNQNSTAPYPNPASPYPNQNSAAPNPNPASPYLNQNYAAPNPNPASPYSKPASPYPKPASPYQNPDAPQPNPASPYPNPTGSAMPYPVSPASNPGNLNPPTEIPSIGFVLPGAQPSGHPVPNAPYPTVNRAHSPLPPNDGHSMPSAPSGDY